jgi:hypothetical protein
MSDFPSPQLYDSGLDLFVGTDGVVMDCPLYDIKTSIFDDASLPEEELIQDA